MTLNLGDEIPVSRPCSAPRRRADSPRIPQSSFNYRPVGVNIDMTPRVTYEGEIILELSVESSTLGASINVGGQDVAVVRLAQGDDAAAAAGRRIEPARRPAARDDQRKSSAGSRDSCACPCFSSSCSNNDQQISQTDIVMLLTPHIVRTHELTAEDLAPIYIGTQQNLGLGGPPPLIAPRPPTTRRRRRSAPGATSVDAGHAGRAARGVPRRRRAAPGAQPANAAAAGDVAGADAVTPCPPAGCRLRHAGAAPPPRRAARRARQPRPPLGGRRRRRPRRPGTRR